MMYGHLLKTEEKGYPLRIDHILVIGEALEGGRVNAQGTKVPANPEGDIGTRRVARPKGR